MLNVLVAIDNGQCCLCCCAVEGGHCNNKATFKPQADLKFSNRILKSCQASLLKFCDKLPCFNEGPAPFCCPVRFRRRVGSEAGADGRAANGIAGMRLGPACGMRGGAVRSDSIGDGGGRCPANWLSNGRRGAANGGLGRREGAVRRDKSVDGGDMGVR